MFNSEVLLDFDDLMMVFVEVYKVLIVFIGVVGEFEEIFKVYYGIIFFKVICEYVFCSYVVEECK